MDALFSRYPHPRKFDGTGLRLFIGKALLELMDNSIVLALCVRVEYTENSAVNAGKADLPQ